MNITLNGDSRRVPQGTTATDLVNKLGLAGRRFALEVNGEIVPKSEHDSFEFRSGDEVEIVHAVGGG
jgi:sulfur carrier protein